MTVDVDLLWREAEFSGYLPLSDAFLVTRPWGQEDCALAARLTGARFAPPAPGLLPVSIDDEGPCAEALVARWLGLDQKKARG